MQQIMLHKKQVWVFFLVFLFSFSVCYSQQKSDTIFLEYTPRQKNLEEVSVVAHSNIRFINKMYTTGCFSQLNAGDTLFDLRSGMKEKDLFDFLDRYLKGFSCDMELAGPRGGMHLGIPYYKGSELGVFIDERPAGSKDFEDIRFRTREIGVIKFFKDFKCGYGTGPAIVIYRRKLSFNN